MQMFDFDCTQCAHFADAPVAGCEAAALQNGLLASKTSTQKISSPNFLLHCRGLLCLHLYIDYRTMVYYTKFLLYKVLSSHKMSNSRLFHFVFRFGPCLLDWIQVGGGGSIGGEPCNSSKHNSSTLASSIHNLSKYSWSKTQ